MNDIQLSPHFWLSEFTRSQTADRLGLDNTPSEIAIQRLKYVAEQMEVVRHVLNKPVTITSGFRSNSVNAAIGSKNTSQHLVGEACDFVVPAYGPPAIVMSALLASGCILYDQMILEFANKGRGWVHCSFTQAPRQQALVIDENGARMYA